MPRRPRMCLPGVPCHVITRGNNRQACFHKNSDYIFYLQCLKESLERFKVNLHAYVLMTNHMHLLMTPQDECGISKVIQSIGRRYVQYFNTRHQRTGTLWEGRYKSSLVADERYVLACYRYIELNPVRANLVLCPQEYQWSSYHFNGEGRDNCLVTMHDAYLNLGGGKQRCENYRQLLNCQADVKQESKIRTAAVFSIPLNDNQLKLR